MRSYFKFLSRNLFYTLVEAAGLSVSLAFVVLIGCYAWRQYAVAAEQPDGRDIYIPGMPDYMGLTYGFKDVAAERLPEVEQIVNIVCEADAVVKFDGEAVEASAIGADRAFFEMFPQYDRLLEGSADALLAADGALVSRTFARRHGIGVGDVLKCVYGDETVLLTVGGIVEDFRNTLLAYTDLIVSAECPLFPYTRMYPFDQYGSTVPVIRLKPGSDVADFRRKMESLCKELYPTMYGRNFFEYLTLTRLDEVFFQETVRNSVFSHGDRRTLRTLLLVGLLLLLSSVFNYVNLNTALVGRRAKEMAVRRLVGATRAGIVGRYVAESVGFTALCFGAALLLAVALAPVMQRLLNDPDVAVRVVFTPATVGGFAGLVLVVGLLSGLLPALLASRFKPVDIVKGRFRVQSKLTFSRVFIVMQSALAVVLLALALVMEAQYRKSLRMPLNARIDDRFMLKPSVHSDLLALGDALAALPCVRRVGRTQGAPGVPGYGQYGQRRDGGDIMYRLARMDSTAFAMLGIEKRMDFGAPLHNTVWFGEEAFRATGFDEHFHDISQTLSQRTRNCEQVGGTIADYPTDFSNEAVSLEGYLAVVLVRSEDMPAYSYYIMETAGDHREAERQIRRAYARWSKEATGLRMEPARAFYLTDRRDEALRPARNNMRLLEVFMLVAMLISTLGLVAISTYYAGEQAKAIAVRKVFGGTVASETLKSVKAYMAMVGVACAAALPVAVWAADKYVEAFVCRIDHYWWLFAVAVVLSAAIAFAAVFWQVWSAARTNPAVELKKE